MGTEFKFKEEMETLPTPSEVTLVPFARVTRCGNFGGDIEVNRESLLEI